MERSDNLLEMLELMARPAFAVKDGTLIYANDAAVHCLFTPGICVTDLLITGAEEYSALEAGCLYLTLEKMTAAGMPV